MSIAQPADGFEIELPPSLRAERRGDIAILTLTRAAEAQRARRSDRARHRGFFEALPADVKAVVLPPRASISPPASISAN